jgi:hypothetical protein
MDGMDYFIYPSSNFTETETDVVRPMLPRDGIQFNRFIEGHVEPFSLEIAWTLRVWGREKGLLWTGGNWKKIAHE